MALQNPIVSNLVLGPIDRTASTPSISFGGSVESNSGTGIYGTFGTINLTISGTLAGAYTSAGLAITNALTVGAGAVVTNNLSVAGILIMAGAGAPVDGTTGDDIAGTGSLYSDKTNGKLYIQTGLITSPTWVLVGSQT